MSATLLVQDVSFNHNTFRHRHRQDVQTDKQSNDIIINSRIKQESRAAAGKLRDAVVNVDVYGLALGRCLT